MRSWAWTCACAVLAGLAGTAGADEGRNRGLSIEVEAWSAAAVGSAIEYAFVVPDEASGGSLSGGGEVRSVEPGRETVTRFTVAKRFDRAGSPSVEFAFHEHDVADADATGDLPARVGAILATPDFAVGRSLVDAAGATRRFRATVGEASMRFRLAPFERAEFEVGGGVRWFRVEHETTATYRVDSLGTTLEQIVVRRGQASGIGPAASVTFRYRIASRLRFGASAAVAVPIGDLDGTTTDVRIGDRFAIVERPGSREAFFQPEVEIRLVVAVTRALEIYCAWRWQSLGDTVRELRFTDDVAQNAAVPEVSGVGWEGAAVGARWSF